MYKMKRTYSCTFKIDYDYSGKTKGVLITYTHFMASFMFVKKSLLKYIHICKNRGTLGIT